jgi:hypothetical protein
MGCSEKIQWIATCSIGQSAALTRKPAATPAAESKRLMTERGSSRTCGAARASPKSGPARHPQSDL